MNLPSVSTFIQGMRAAISFAERSKNAELLGQLQKTLLDGQEVINSNLELSEANRNLQSEIEGLRSKLAFSENLVFINGLYHSLDAERRIGEPYCPTCWEVNRVAVHLHFLQHVGYRCNNCSKGFPYARRSPDSSLTDELPGDLVRPTLKQFADEAERMDR